MSNNREEKLLKLYQLNRGTRIGVAHLRLTDQNGTAIKELDFHGIDGAYSNCTTDDSETIHLSASAEVLYLSKIIQDNG